MVDGELSACFVTNKPDHLPNFFADDGVNARRTLRKMMFD